MPSRKSAEGSPSRPRCTPFEWRLPKYCHGGSAWILALVFAFATAPSARADLPHSIAAKDATYCNFERADNLKFASVLGYCKPGNTMHVAIDGSDFEMLVHPSTLHYGGDLRQLTKLPDVIATDLLTISKCDMDTQAKCRLGKSAVWIPPLLSKVVGAKQVWELGPRPNEDFFSKLVSRYDVSIYLVQLDTKLVVIVAHLDMGGLFDTASRQRRLFAFASLPMRRYDLAVLQE